MMIDLTDVTVALDSLGIDWAHGSQGEIVVEGQRVWYEDDPDYPGVVVEHEPVDSVLEMLEVLGC